MIQSDIVTAFDAAGITDLSPEAIGQDMMPPFVIYVRTSFDPLQTLLGATGDANSEFIFECYGYNKMQALTLAAQVRAAVVAARSSYLGGTGVLPVQYELPVTTEAYTPETMEYMEPVGYSFWHT